MSALDKRVSNALHATARRWRQALARDLRGSGVSQAGWSAVAAAAATPRPPAQTRLAQWLGVEGVTIAQRMAVASAVLEQRQQRLEESA
jgi:hypothetical protein